MKAWVRRHTPPEARNLYRRLFGQGGVSTAVELARLRRQPRYEPGQTDLLGTPTEYADAASFLSSYRAIFVDRCYAFPTNTTGANVTMMDCGANIGLASIATKLDHPEARIVAFEPDPQLLMIAQRNIARWGLDDVELVQAAVWIDEGTLPFKPDGADAGQVLPPAVGARGTTTVPTIRLRDRLGEPIDLLKLDVEGAEVDVVLDCAPRLHQVNRLFVEYHSWIGREQRIDELLSVLRSSGFRTHLQSEFASPRPFTRLPTDAGMDNRVNVFAWRP